MTYPTRRRIRKDPITGKSLAWQRREIPEYLDEDDHFDPELWYPKNEPAPVEDFIFHPNSLAAIIGVSVGYLPTVEADERFHTYNIGPVGRGIRPTSHNSGQWFGEVRGQEARARQSVAGREVGAGNLIRWRTR